MTGYDPIFKFGLILAILIVIFSGLNYIFQEYKINFKEDIDILSHRGDSNNNNLIAPKPTSFVAISGPTPMIIPRPTFTPRPTEIPSVTVAPTPATFTISGYIKGPNNNRWSNASIELSGNGVGINIYADEKGNYMFDRLYNGNYTIRVNRQKWKIQINGTDIIINLTVINNI